MIKKPEDVQNASGLFLYSGTAVTFQEDFSLLQGYC